MYPQGECTGSIAISTLGSNVNINAHTVFQEANKGVNGAWTATFQAAIPLL